MKKPSVIDLKIGRRTYAEDATPEKKESMTKKSLNSSSHVIGFRISGMKVYCPQKRKYANFDKIRCREVSRTPESVAHGLDIFFSELDPIRRQGLLLQSILPILHKLSKDISELSATLYSSSLLIAFDGSTLAEVDESIPFVVKIIDFAHSQWEEGPSFDKKILSDYLDGLNNVIHHLERIAQ